MKQTTVCQPPPTLLFLLAILTSA